MTKTITVRIKNVYGNELIYPVCDNAKAFAQMSEKKTLSARNIDIIKKMGYTVQVETPTL